jgi:Arf-GAP with dual PH domain-containing protein
MNVVFAHEKLPTATSLQISYLHQGSTRHIYVYHEDAEVIVDWYMAIRSAKLNLMHVAHPNLTEAEVAQMLTQDFLKEGTRCIFCRYFCSTQFLFLGFLYKTGPKSSDGYKKRWFTFDGRKLMYHEQSLVSRSNASN